MATQLIFSPSVKGKRVITYEGDRTVQDILQFAEKADRYFR